MEEIVANRDRDKARGARVRVSARFINPNNNDSVKKQGAPPARYRFARKWGLTVPLIVVAG